MSEKTTRLFLSFFTGVTVFLSTVLVVFFSFSSNNQKKWFIHVLQTNIFYGPLWVYLIMLALLLGGMVFMLLSIMQKSQYRKVEEKLQLLAYGSYEHPKLTLPIEQGKTVSPVTEIDRDIMLIREKLLEMSRELQLLNSRPQIVSGQTKEEILEVERHRLARELHDSVSQQLFAAMMMLSALNEQAAQQVTVSDAVKKQLAIIMDIINTSQSEMRALLLHLRPVSLEGKSLRSGIEQLLLELQNKIKIELRWDIEDIRLKSSIEDNLFRIMQELLSNTLRHAKANGLEVYLHQVDQNVLLKLVDDGIGFDVKANNNNVGSFGLQNIRERVAGMGGSLKIISFKGQGTSVEIKVPVLKEDVNND